MWRIAVVLAVVLCLSLPASALTAEDFGLPPQYVDFEYLQPKQQQQLPGSYISLDAENMLVFVQNASAKAALQDIRLGLDSKSLVGMPIYATVEVVAATGALRKNVSKVTFEYFTPDSTEARVLVLLPREVATALEVHVLEGTLLQAMPNVLMQFRERLDQGGALHGSFVIDRAAPDVLQSLQVIAVRDAPVNTEPPKQLTLEGGLPEKESGEDTSIYKTLFWILLVLVVFAVTIFIEHRRENEDRKV